MLPYLEIARALEDASREERRDARADLLASLLKALPPESVRPVARLLSGRLWPPWEPREMGIGPETLEEVLEEISGQVPSPEAKGADPGDLAERMVQGRSQRTLSPTTLDALQVYEALRQISSQRGVGSTFRKRSILRGLLLSASPLEAKYIAKTVRGRMAVGLGLSLLAEAIGRAFGVDPLQVKRAYSYNPDYGTVALHALRGEVCDLRLSPSHPSRQMAFRRDEHPWDAMGVVGRRAYVVRYGGLRVQVHKLSDQVFFYTSQLRNVTHPLRDLAEEVIWVKGNFILEGELILVEDGRILPLSVIVGRINLRGRSRGEAVSSLAASDLLYLNGRDLIDESYAERRRSLVQVLRNVAGRPLVSRVFLAEEEVLEDPDGAKKFLGRSLDRGFRGVIMRDPEGAYILGGISRWDEVISEMPEDQNPLQEDRRTYPGRAGR